MKKMFVTASFGDADSKKVVDELCALVRKAGWEDFCFIRDVENYQVVFDDPKDLMERAREEMEKCDALLIDMTDKPTGRAIEAGMAYAMGKEVWVMAKKGTVLKGSTLGIAKRVIEYSYISDIAAELVE